MESGRDLMGIVRSPLVRVLSIPALLLCVSASTILVTARTAAAAQPDPSGGFIATCTHFASEPETTDVWYNVVGMTSAGGQYTVQFATPTHGATNGSFSDYPYGPDLTVGVDSIAPGTYTYSGSISDSVGGTWSIPSQTLYVRGCAFTSPVVGIAADTSGHGYWEAGSDGNVYASGDAINYGSMAGARLNSPVVGIAATPDGKGYW